MCKRKKVKLKVKEWQHKVAVFFLYYIFKNKKKNVIMIVGGSVEIYELINIYTSFDKRISELWRLL